MIEMEQLSFCKMKLQKKKKEKTLENLCFLLPLKFNDDIFKKE